MVISILNNCSNFMEGEQNKIKVYPIKSNNLLNTGVQSRAFHIATFPLLVFNSCQIHWIYSVWVINYFSLWFNSVTKLGKSNLKSTVKCPAVFYMTLFQVILKMLSTHTHTHQTTSQLSFPKAKYTQLLQFLFTELKF